MWSDASGVLTMSGRTSHFLPAEVGGYIIGLYVELIIQRAGQNCSERACIYLGWPNVCSELSKLNNMNNGIDS